MYLVDTNVVSELRRVAAGRGSPQVAAWQARCKPADCWFSVVSLMELDIGVLRAERRDVRQGRLLRQWLDEAMLSVFAERLLDVDRRVAGRAARLHVPDPRPANDALIAATALVHGLVVVTRNVRDFVGTGVFLLNPWEPAAVQEAPAQYEGGYARND